MGLLTGPPVTPQAIASTAFAGTRRAAGCHVLPAAPGPAGACADQGGGQVAGSEGNQASLQGFRLYAVCQDLQVAVPQVHCESLEWWAVGCGRACPHSWAQGRG